MNNQLLLISQLAKLFHISQHTIRFYEKKGLISPVKTTEKGYRLYDFSTITHLEQILFLRKLDMPLDEIAEYMDSKDIQHYNVALNDLESNITSRIKHLTEILKALNTQKSAVSDYIAYGEDFFLKTYDTRYLYTLKTIQDPFSFDLDETTFFQLISAHPNYEDIKSSHEIIFKSTYQDIQLCLVVNPEDLEHFEEDLLEVLPKGRYICKYHQANTKKTYNKLLKDLGRYAKTNSYPLSDYVLDLFSTEHHVFLPSNTYTLFQILITCE